MPRRRLTLTALLASGLATSGCAWLRPPSAPVPPPTLSIPDAASRPCVLPTLPDDATQGDLDATYALRGQAVVLCDAARALAVEGWLAERSLVEEWATRKRRPDPG